MKTRAEIAFHADRCIACRDCARVCPSGAITDGARRIDRDRCHACGRCASVCPTVALEKIGDTYTPETLVSRLLRDRTFFETSAGGVTFSGGEPTLFPDYLEAVLSKLKGDGIHTLIETCGAFDWPRFRDRLLPNIDLVYFDVKFVDPHLHRQHTGMDNRRILANLAALSVEAPEKVQPRVPLIPGLTATEENLGAIHQMLLGLGIKRIVMLPYNAAGVSKRAALDLPMVAAAQGCAL